MTRSLADEQYVSFTTFRKNGTAVPTPVWIAPDGERLAFLTEGDAGKVKRLRNNSRVELTPCDLRGRVKEGAPTSTGNAVVSADPAEVKRVREVMAAKYGLQAKVFGWVEAIASRVGVKTTPRAAVVITLDSPNT